MGRNKASRTTASTADPCATNPALRPLARITALPVRDDTRSNGGKRAKAEWAEPLDPAAWQDADYDDGLDEQADDYGGDDYDEDDDGEEEPQEEDSSEEEEPPSSPPKPRRFKGKAKQKGVMQDKGKGKPAMEVWPTVLELLM